MKYFLIFFLTMLPMRLSAQQSSNSLADKDIIQTAETVESFLDQLDTWHGVPFLAGGTDKELGVDANGLIRAVYKDVFGLILPSTADSMWKTNTGKRISIPDDDLLPGDIIFFQKNNIISDAVLFIGDDDEDNVIHVHPDNGVQSGKLQDIKGQLAGAKRFIRFYEPARLRGSGYLSVPVETNVTRDELIAEIQTWIGTPYAWGNNKKQTGTDCSGFVTSLYRTLFNITLPRTSLAMWTDPIGKKIDDRQLLLPGDALFFQYGERVSHVAIYIGKNKQGIPQLAHATNVNNPLGIDDFDESSYLIDQFAGAKRFVILNDQIAAHDKMVTPIIKKDDKTKNEIKTKTEVKTEINETLYRSSQSDINSVSISKGKNQLTISWVFKSGAQEKQTARLVTDDVYYKTFSVKYPDPLFYRYEYVWKNEKHTGTLLEDRNSLIRAEIDENQNTEEIIIFTYTPAGSPSAGTKKTASAKTDTLPANNNKKTDVFQTGEASYYAQQFHGRKTANGEIFDMNQLTAAHRSLPFNTKVKVTNLQNQRQIIVRINDRGPFVKGRIIDVSYEAAKQLDMIRSGVADITIELLNE